MGWFGPGAGGGWAPTARRDSLTHVLLKGFTVSMMLSDTELDIAVDGLRNLGYAVVHTSGESAALMLAARDLGRRIGARTFGYVHLRADGSPGWLGRHTESLTDSSTPLRYFALGCHISALEGGATHLFDGEQAARLLVGQLGGADQVFIRYRSAYRPDTEHHPLIARHEEYGQVLRFRSACEYNSVTALPLGLSEVDMYLTVEDAVSASLAHVHRWRAGDLLIVDNHRMLHSRAPFAGRRHMLRVRYDDPLRQTVTLAG